MSVIPPAPRPALPDLIRTTHAPLSRATLSAAGGVTLALELEAGTLTATASSTARRTATLTVPWRQDVWEAVNEYAVCSVLLEGGYRYPDGAETWGTLATLHTRRVVSNRPADTIELELGDPTQRIAEWPFTADDTPTGTVSTYIQRMITECQLGILLTVDTDGPLPAEYATKAGDDRWQSIESVCDAAALDCHSTRLGDLVLTTPPTLHPQPAPSVAVFDVGPTGVVADSMADYDREDWGNACLAMSRWRLEDGTEELHRGWAYNTDPADPSRFDGPAGRKAWVEVRDGNLTDAALSVIAQQVLYRRAGAGRGTRVGVPAVWWIEPGDPVDIHLPYGDIQTQLVQTVTHDLVGHTATVETRHPYTSSITSTPAARL